MKNHSYIFLNIDPSFFELPQEDANSFRTQFVDSLDQEDVVIYCYAIVGFKADTSILLWIQSDEIEKNQDTLNLLLHTSLGKYLKVSHTLFGMTRPTQYSSRSKGHLDTGRKGKKYLVIYPFNKTKDWYMLDFDKRKELMVGHVTVGKKYPQIEQLLLYSYGVDDNEFIVSYETNDLAEFQSLVMDLRSDPVRMYTAKDTPIFTCIYKTHEEIQKYL